MYRKSFLGTAKGVPVDATKYKVNGEREALFGASNNADEDRNYNMLTDMTPSAGQFYGSQIPSMGMNSHIQKPTVSVSAVSKITTT